MPDTRNQSGRSNLLWQEVETEKRDQVCHRRCETSQKEGVVVTRNGKPTSLIIGVEGREWEDLVVQTDPKFWQLIEERRQQKTVSLSEMKKRVLPAKKSRKAGKQG